MSYWKNQKRAERERQFEEQCEREREEAYRWDNLCLASKIEEVEDIHDVKRVLTAMAEKLGLDLYA